MFDGETAKRDPRANGKDTSVGIIELPLQPLMHLMEILMSSSRVFPPICRAMGQFYVSIFYNPSTLIYLMITFLKGIKSALLFYSLSYRFLSK